MLGLGRPGAGDICSNRICRIWAGEGVKAIRKRREKVEIPCFGQEHMKPPEGPFNNVHQRIMPDSPGEPGRRRTKSAKSSRLEDKSPSKRRYSSYRLKSNCSSLLLKLLDPFLRLIRVRPFLILSKVLSKGLEGFCLHAFGFIAVARPVD